MNDFGEGIMVQRQSMIKRENNNTLCFDYYQILFKSCIKSSKKTNIGWFLELGTNTF
jgi:hypothetical protein